jgi:hypothetical protein
MGIDPHFRGIDPHRFLQNSKVGEPILERCKFDSNSILDFLGCTKSTRVVPNSINRPLSRPNQGEKLEEKNQRLQIIVFLSFSLFLVFLCYFLMRMIFI